MVFVSRRLMWAHEEDEELIGTSADLKFVLAKSERDLAISSPRLVCLNNATGIYQESSDDKLSVSMEGQDQMSQAGQHAFHAEDGSQSDLPPPSKRQRVSQVRTPHACFHQQWLRRRRRNVDTRVVLMLHRLVGRVEIARRAVMAVSRFVVLARPEECRIRVTSTVRTPQSCW